MQDALLIGKTSVQSFLSTKDLYSVFNLLRPFLPTFFTLVLSVLQTALRFIIFLFCIQTPSSITWLALSGFHYGVSLTSAAQQQKSYPAKFQKWGSLSTLHSILEVSISWKDLQHLTHGHSKTIYEPKEISGKITIYKSKVFLIFSIRKT